MATEKRLKGYDPITLESFTRHMTKHREPYDQYDMGYVDAVDQIENWLEYNTVEAVEVVHGRWEDRENPQWKAYDIRHCSVCGWSIPKTKLRQKDSHWNYCPNCGAKMDGGKDNG